MLNKYAVLGKLIVWLVTMGAAGATYFHTQASVNQNINSKVQSLEDRIEANEEETDRNAKISCHIAIALKVKDATDICTREVFR